MMANRSLLEIRSIAATATKDHQNQERDPFPIPARGSARRSPLQLGSTAQLWHGASRRRGKIDTGAGRDDAGWIDGAVAAVIVGLDMVEMHRPGHAGYLIQGAGVVP